MASHNKPVIFETKLSNDPSSLNFTQSRFLSSIDKHGYDVNVERAMRCPCVNKASGQPRLDCSNCGSVGWVWINRRKTRAVIQQMNRETKYRQWTEQDSGRVSITFRHDEDIAFMDKLVNIELVSTYSEVVHLKNIGTVGSPQWVGTLIYYPLDIINAFIFVDSASPLRSISSDQYTISNHIITITDVSVLDGLDDAVNPSITFRYHHNPTFHVLEITRERIGTREEKCEDGSEQLNLLPIHAIGLRAHEILNRPDINGGGLQDNTLIGENQDF